MADLFLFFKHVRMKRTCILPVSIRIRTQSMEVKITWIIVLNLGLDVFEKHMRNCQIPSVPTRTFTYHLEEITGTLWYIYRNDLLIYIEPSGWKGSVTHGLGADISLPPCLATGIWNLAPKATSGPKSRGASFGTKLWRHVQRYCVQFLAFMLIKYSGYYLLRKRNFGRFWEFRWHRDICNITQIVLLGSSPTGRWRKVSIL